MDPLLIQVLLRCVQSPNASFRTGVTLSRFVSDFGIGSRRRQSFVFSTADKDRIRALLNAANVPLDADPAAFKSMTRTEALRWGDNEKQTRRAVRQNRIALKSLYPDQRLYISDDPLRLPPGAHLDCDWTQIRLNGHHDWIIVIENWETFLRPDRYLNRLDFPGTSPLVAWRGDPTLSMRGLLDWLETHKLPVAAFVDFDPKGLIIANALPRLQHVVAPSLIDLTALLEGKDGKGLAERYAIQVAQCQNTLDSATNPDIRALWKVIRHAGRALPQEYYGQAIDAT